MKKDSKKQYWLTPPKHYKTLNDEFHFDFDPCPFPKPINFDGLSAEWGESNYVNPPFKKEDGGGIAYWITKGIEENRKGKTVVFLIHVDRAIMKLIKAGAEIRTLGETAWLSTQDGSEGYSHPSAVFILKGNPPHDPKKY